MNKLKKFLNFIWKDVKMFFQMVLIAVAFVAVILILSSVIGFISHYFGFFLGKTNLDAGIDAIAFIGFFCVLFYCIILMPIFWLYDLWQKATRE